MKPVQRITKYGILLDAIRRKTDCVEHRLLIDQCSEAVYNFVLQINSELRTRDEEEKLTAVYNRIVSFDFWDTINDEVVNVRVRVCYVSGTVDFLSLQRKKLKILVSFG